jgi:serine/threonine-protein kinase HipA
MKNFKKKYLSSKLNVDGVEEPSSTYGKRCLHCYELLKNVDGEYHTACVKKFFGQLYAPTLSYKRDELRMLAAQVLQSQMAVTGVQPKISLSLFRKADRNMAKKLTIVGLYGDYILKPPSDHYQQLPELESVTMHMAHTLGLRVVPHSLVRLEDNTLCYITKRVDRTRKGKLHMEDFCQISGRMTEDKYKGSHEQVAKLILKYSTNPLLDVTSFFELVLFCFLTGNSDMHLKNFSLLEQEGMGMALSPFYDLLPTTLVNPLDTEELALTLNAKKRKLKYNDFLVAYETCGLSQKVLDKTLELFVFARPELQKVLSKSFVDDEYKLKYLTLINSRYHQLGLE